MWLVTQAGEKTQLTGVPPVVYRGQGSVSYTGGSWGGGRGVLMMINYDPNI